MEKKPKFLKNLLTTASTLALVAVASDIYSAPAARITIGNATLNDGAGLDQKAGPANEAFETKSTLKIHDNGVAINTNGVALTILGIGLNGKTGVALTVSDATSLGSVAGEAGNALNQRLAVAIGAAQTLTLSGDAGAPLPDLAGNAAPNANSIDILANTYTGLGKITFGAGSILTIDNTAAGAPGTITLKGPFDATAGGAILNVITALEVNDQSFAAIQNIVIGKEAVPAVPGPAAPSAPSTLTVDSTNGVNNLAGAGNHNVDLLPDAVNSKIRFANEGSTLILRNTYAGATNKIAVFTLQNDLNPLGAGAAPNPGNATGIIQLDAANANSRLVLTSNGGKTLGVAGGGGEGNIAELNITGGGIVTITGGANFVDLSNVKKLNIINGANFISGTNTVTAIPIINIGAAPVGGGGAAGKATFIIDGTEDVGRLGAPGDYNVDLLDAGAVNAIKFLDVTSTLILRNTDANNDGRRLVFTLLNNLDPLNAVRGDNAPTGIIQLDAGDANSIIVLTSKGGKTLGTAAGKENKIAQLNITGKGKVFITGKTFDDPILLANVKNNVDLTNVRKINVTKGANLVLETIDFKGVEMDIGEAGGAGNANAATLTIDGTQAVVNSVAANGAGNSATIKILEANGLTRHASQQFKFYNADSTLILSNRHTTVNEKAIFVLQENLVPTFGHPGGPATGIIELNAANANSVLVLQSKTANAYSLGAAPTDENIKQLNITGNGQVIISGIEQAATKNSVQLTKVKEINIKKGASLTLETPAAYYSGVDMNIGEAGAAANKGTLTIDGTQALTDAIAKVPATANVDIDLLTANGVRGAAAEQFKFLNEDSTLILSSKHATAGKTVTFKLNANLNPNNGSVNPNGTGIIELNAEDGNSNLFLTSSAGAKTLGIAGGSAGEKIKQLNITGGGIVNIFGGANYVDLSNINELNVKKNVDLVAGKTVADIPTINIGEVGGRGALVINGTADLAIGLGDLNIDILDNAATKKIVFKHNKSILKFSNDYAVADGKVLKFTLQNDLNPLGIAPAALVAQPATGVIILHAGNANSTLILTANGSKTLGVVGGGGEGNIAQIDVTGNGKVIITGSTAAVGGNNVDLTNVRILNITKGANLIAQTSTVTAIPTINIGTAGVAAANFTIDGTTVVNDAPVPVKGGAPLPAGVPFDVNIEVLNAGGTHAIKFSHVDAKLILQNKSNNAIRRLNFILQDHLNPLSAVRGDAAPTGILELNAGDANSTLILSSNGGKSLGTNGNPDEEKIAQLNITGPGKVFITGSTAAGSVNNVDLQYVSKLNITKAANLIAQTDSIAKIPVINIGTTAGAGAGKATVTIDGTEALKAEIAAKAALVAAIVPTEATPINADIVLLNAGTNRGAGAVPGQQFLFEHHESTLVLSNKNDEEYTSLTFILNTHLTPVGAGGGDAAGTGIVELNADGANSTLILKSANTKHYTLGTNGRVEENIRELNITGTGSVIIAGDDTVTVANLGGVSLEFVKTINIKKEAKLYIENPTIFTKNNINVGVAAGAADAGGGNLIVSTKWNDVTLLDGHAINFLHADSRLAFLNEGGNNRVITLKNNLNPGANNENILYIASANPANSLTVSPNAAQTIGTDGGPVFKEINTIGPIVVNTKAYATTLNVQNETATFANTLGTTTINIGTAAVPAAGKLGLDAALVLKNVDQTINDVAFQTADSELKLYNENLAVVGANVTINLNNAIVPAADEEGKVELKADNKNLIIADGGAGKFGNPGGAGVARARLQEFNVAAAAGAGEVTVAVPVYAKEANIGGKVTFNKVVGGGAGSKLTFTEDSKIKFDEGVSYEIIDFAGKDGEITVADDKPLEALLINSTGDGTAANPALGEVIFAGKGTLRGPTTPDLSGAIADEPLHTFFAAAATKEDRLTLLKQKAIKQVTVKTAAADEFNIEGLVPVEELIAENAPKINFENGALLVGSLNKTAGGKVNLNFRGDGRITGNIGRVGAGGAIGDITIQGNNKRVRLDDDVYATNIGFTGNDSRVILNDDLTLDGALDLTNNGIEIEKNIVLTGNLRGDNPSFFVGNKTLDYHGDAAFRGTLTFDTEITPVNDKSIGRIVVKAGGKFDMSDVETFVVNLSGNTAAGISYSRIELIDADGGEVVVARNIQLNNTSKGPIEWVLHENALEPTYVAEERTRNIFRNDPQGQDISSTMGGQDQEPNSDAASQVNVISTSTPEQTREGVNDQMNVVSQDSQVVQNLSTESITAVVATAMEGSMITARIANLAIPLDGGFLTPDITPTFNIEPGPSVIVPAPIEGGTPAAGPAVGGAPSTSPAVGGTRENNATPAGGAGTPAGGRTAPTREQQRREEQNAELMGVAAGDMVGARLGFWGSPFYNKTTQKQKGFTPGNNATSKGGTIGIDTLFNEDTLVGAAFTFANTKINFKGEKEGDNTKVNTYMLSVYGLRTLPKNFYVQTILSFSQSNVDHKEYRSFVKNTAKAKYDLNSYGGEVSFGYNHRLNMFSAITPTLGVRYTKLNQSEFTETGANGIDPITGRPFTANMRYPSDSSQKLDGMIGVRIMGVHAQNEVTFLPEMHLQYAHDFIAKEKKSKAYLQGQAKPQPTRPVKPESNFFNIGGGINVKYQISEFGLNYELTTAKKMMSHQGMFKLRVNI